MTKTSSILEGFPTQKAYLRQRGLDRHSDAEMLQKAKDEYRKLYQRLYKRQLRNMFFELTIKLPKKRFSAFEERAQLYEESKSKLLLKLVDKELEGTPIVIHHSMPSEKLLEFLQEALNTQNVIKEVSTIKSMYCRTQHIKLKEVLLAAIEELKKHGHH